MVKGLLALRSPRRLTPLAQVEMGENRSHHMAPWRGQRSTVTGIVRHPDK